MTINGQGKVYEQITERMWQMEGEIYGTQPGDHKYGKETTDALQHKRQRRAEVMQYVEAIKQQTQENELQGVIGTWQRWANMQRAERDLVKIQRQDMQKWRQRIKDELQAACRNNKAS